MKKKSTYDKDLYDISINIFNNTKGKYTDRQPLDVHNSLLPFYQQLNEGIVSGKKDDSMPTLDLKNASKESIQNLCEFYLEYMRDQNADSTVRKVKNNLSKISLEHDTKLIDNAMSIAEKSFESNSRQQYIEVRTCIDKYYPFYQQTIKDIISKALINLLRFLDSTNQKNRKRQILSSAYSTLEDIYFNIDEFINTDKTWGIWKNHYTTLLYLDVSCWIILHTVIYSIIYYNKSNTKVESIEEITKKIKGLINDFERKSVTCSNNIFLTYSEYLLFSIFRSYFMEDANILVKLKEECSDVNNPEKEYSLFESEGTPKKVRDNERIYIYLERSDVDEKDIRTFKSNYDKCIEFVTLYNKKTNRTLKCDDITLKAVYRQLILDKTIQNRRKSKIIFNQFIKNKQFSNYSEYYFINEKINLGMFREHGLLKEFWAKNELQKNLYILVSLLLTRLTPEKIYQDSKQNFSEIYSVLKTQIEKIDC